MTDVKVTPMDEEILDGGIANAGQVVRVPHVLRPSNPHSGSIHAFLRSLRDAGFTGAPMPVGIDEDGRERLVFIPGEVPVAPYPSWSQSDTALASVARLLRALHDTARWFDPEGLSWDNNLADRAGGSLVCHNDVCPENVVFRSGIAVGLVDFEFAAPGRPVYDLAHLGRLCVPIDDEVDQTRLGWRPADRFARLRSSRMPTDWVGMAGRNCSPRWKMRSTLSKQRSAAVSLPVTLHMSRCGTEPVAANDMNASADGGLSTVTGSSPPFSDAVSNSLNRRLLGAGQGQPTPLRQAPSEEMAGGSGCPRRVGGVNPDAPCLEDAIALAAAAHRGQRYPSPVAEPYIFHSLKLMLRFHDQIDQMAAVLHDAIEDSDLEVRDLVEAGYPADLVAAIDALTHRANESYHSYIERVAGNDVARRVKIADLGDNLANNYRAPNAPGNADRITRYESALARLCA
jgi:hypothetical protein